MPTTAYTDDRVARWEARTRWILTTLAALFLVAYAIPILWPHVPDTVEDVAWVMAVVVWAAFAGDYVIRLAMSSRKLAFVRANIIDLIIVVLPPARPLRLLRVIVVLVETITRQATLRPRSRFAVFVGGTVALMILVGALAVLDAERGAPDAKITSYADAIWWAMVTVTTVGYGDYFPVTVEGKCIAVGLMLAGIGLIAFVTGSLASWVVEKVAAEGEQSDELTRGDVLDVLREVRILRAEVAELRAERDGGRAAAPGGAVPAFTDGGVPKVPDARHDAPGEPGASG